MVDNPPRAVDPSSPTPLESLLDQSQRPRIFDRRVDIANWAGECRRNKKRGYPSSGSVAAG
jgi:hypothetical protein